MNNRVLALLLCVACFLFAACSNGTSDTVVVNENDQVAEIETTEELESIPDYDLTQVNASEILDFVNGRAWLQFINDNQTETVCIDNKGMKQFSVTGIVIYASPFIDDTAFLVYKDGPGEKVGETLFHETIVDLQGNELYSTSIDDTSKEKHEEHILAYGEGKFVVLRNYSDIYKNEWTLGTIDAHGNIIDEFKPYTFVFPEPYLNDYVVGSDLIPEWDQNDKFHLREVYDRMQFGILEATNLDNSEIPEYLGEGAFYLTNAVVYQPSKGKICVLESKDTDFRGSASNGFVISPKGWRWSRVSINESSSESFGFENGPDSSLYLRNRGMKNGLFFYDHGYYDVFGNEIIHVKGFDTQSIFCTPFTDGYALMTINGADENTYVTMIDSNGISQFEPFKTERLSDQIDDGFFVSCYNGKAALYDHNGNEVMDLPFRKSDISRYYVSEGFVRLVNTENGDYLMRIPVQNTDDEPMAPDGSFVDITPDGKWALLYNGTVVNGFSGIATNRHGSWYIKNGYVDFSANGDINFNGRTFSVSNGRVINY